MKVYPSKIGVGLSIALVLSYVLTICAMFFDNEKQWWLIIVVSLLYGFIFYSFLNTKYVIENDRLVIRLGFLTMKTISIDSIVKIEETRSPLSSPASSMHRWEIIYNKFDSIIVSPKDAEGFVCDLLQLNAGIKVVHRVKS